MRVASDTFTHKKLNAKEIRLMGLLDEKVKPVRAEVDALLLVAVNKDSTVAMIEDVREKVKPLQERLGILHV